MPSSSPGGYPRLSRRGPLLVAIFAATCATVGAVSACGEDDPTIAFIGAVDAGPPRLGRAPPDAGAR